MPQIRDEFIAQLRAIVQTALARTLMDTLSKVQTCACGRLFVKVTRKAYCSRRCQNRFYMRTVRARKLQKRRSAEIRWTA